MLWLGDAACAARVLMTVRAARRPWVLERMVREAARADLWRRRTGRGHPVWGAGSLMVVALRRHPIGEPPLSDPAFHACLTLVLARVRPAP